MMWASASQPRSGPGCRRARANQGRALRVAAKTRPALTGPARGGCEIWRSGRKNARSPRHYIQNFRLPHRHLRSRPLFRQSAPPNVRICSMRSSPGFCADVGSAVRSQFALAYGLLERSKRRRIDRWRCPFSQSIGRPQKWRRSRQACRPHLCHRHLDLRDRRLHSVATVQLAINQVSSSDRSGKKIGSLGRRLVPFRNLEAEFNGARSLAAYM
jgi:hypothetical protein